jgi:lysosomal acid lipase/cholesteryl ester hydrolase
MGIYDLPAMIEKIKSKSGVEKITYIGHSQGTTQLFVGFSQMEKYFNENLNGFIGLGPVAKIDNIKSSFLKAVADFNIISLFKFLGINEIFQSPSSVNKFSAIICDNLYILCSGLLKMLSDNKTNFDDEKRFLVFISHFPSGASRKTLKHFSFIFTKKEFLDLNTQKKYNFEDKFEIPVALFVGKEDKLSTPEDARNIRNAFMNNGVLHFYKEYEGMGHATFFLTKTKEYINDVIRCIEDFNYFKNVSKSKILKKD